MKQYFCNTILIFFLFCFNNISSQHISKCNELLESSESVLRDVKCKIDKLPEPYYFKKTELFSIVLPEFILYNTFNKYIEEIYLQYALKMNYESYLTTSIGPFQMTPKFIFSCLEKSSFSMINDSLMRDIKKGNYQIFHENLEYFSKIEVQWEVLILFERIFWDSSNIDINMFRRVYHSGENRSYLFSKIECHSETYEFWSDYLSKLYSDL